MGNIGPGFSKAVVSRVSVQLYLYLFFIFVFVSVFTSLYLVFHDIHNATVSRVSAQTNEGILIRFSTRL